MTDQKPRISRIVLVGHCVPDSATLTNLVRRSLGPIPVVRVNGAAALASAAAADALWLVNRVLDGEFESDSGVELIRRGAGRPNAPLMMLVSNFADAQAAAAAAGALPGFGKKAVGAAATTELLKRAAGLPEPQARS
jgi:hypothetical protein